MSNAIEFKNIIITILDKKGYLVEFNNKKSFKITHLNDLMCDAIMISQMIQKELEYFNVSNILEGKNSLQDLCSYRVSIQDLDTIVVEIYNLQSYKDKRKIFDIDKELDALVNTAGDFD